ncbi:MAG TPA: SHOCT domain-containing protein [Pseudonocardiaceae bacterium]|jgi:putative membrane protein
MSEHVLAQWAFDNGWGGGGWGGPWAGFAPWWGLGTLVVAACAAVLIVYLVRRSRFAAPLGRVGSATQLSAAEDMLARRFAAGEISEEEYLSRLAVLRRPVQ